MGQTGSTDNSGSAVQFQLPGPRESVIDFFGLLLQKKDNQYKGVSHILVMSQPAPVPHSYRVLITDFGSAPQTQTASK